MSRDHVGHRDIVRFAEERVNLPQDKAQEYRAQARRLREKHMLMSIRISHCGR